MKFRPLQNLDRICIQAYVCISLHPSTNTGCPWHLFLLKLCYQLGRRLRKKVVKKILRRMRRGASSFKI